MHSIDQGLALLGAASPGYRGDVWRAFERLKNGRGTSGDLLAAAVHLRKAGFEAQAARLRRQVLAEILKYEPDNKLRKGMN